MSGVGQLICWAARPATTIKSRGTYGECVRNLILNRLCMNADVPIRYIKAYTMTNGRKSRLGRIRRVFRRGCRPPHTCTCACCMRIKPGTTNGTKQELFKVSECTSSAHIQASVGMRACGRGHVQALLLCTLVPESSSYTLPDRSKRKNERGILSAIVVPITRTLKDY